MPCFIVFNGSMFGAKWHRLLVGFQDFGIKLIALACVNLLHGTYQPEVIAYSALILYLLHLPMPGSVSSRMRTAHYCLHPHEQSAVRTKQKLECRKKH
eukprot:3749533-Amphidinium_carterae.1